jgi:hypothetical protein
MRFSEVSWFTEGFHTADLKDAKALLSELGRQLAISSTASNLNIEQTPRVLWFTQRVE